MKDYHGVQITPCLLIILFLSTCLPMFETGFREDKRTLEGALEQAKFIVWVVWVINPIILYGIGNNSLVMPESKYFIRVRMML